MSFADERRAIETRFSANYTSTPVRYENLSFVQPDNASWVSLMILSGEGGQASLGGSSAIHRYGGVIQVDVFTPENSGTQAGRALADTVEAIFRQVQFSLGNSGVIHTQTPWVTNLGVEDGWYRLVVTCPFFRDRKF